MRMLGTLAVFAMAALPIWHLSAVEADTMKLEDYKEINGHIDTIKPLQQVLDNLKYFKKV